MHCDKVNETFNPELAREDFLRACDLRVKKVEFTLSQCVICYDISLITLSLHLLGVRGVKNYNVSKINVPTIKLGRGKSHLKC